MATNGSSNGGIQEVIEDYVHTEGAKIAALIALRFACFFLGAAGVFAVLKIAFTVAVPGAPQA